MFILSTLCPLSAIVVKAMEASIHAHMIPAAQSQHHCMAEGHVQAKMEKVAPGGGPHSSYL